MTIEEKAKFYKDITNYLNTFELDDYGNILADEDEVCDNCPYAEQCDKCQLWWGCQYWEDSMGEDI